MFQLAKQYGAMWIVFVIMVFIGTLGLEMMEGQKIMTSEYYGLANLRHMYLVVILFFICLPASAVYFLALLPISNLLRKGTRTMFWVRTVIFIGLGAVGGRWIFHRQFGSFVQRYDLNEYMAIIIFGVCGLLYALIDGFLAKKALRVNSASCNYSR